MISILLATYNGERFIEKSIDSILSQTCKDWELLIGFNGTNDNSKELVNKYRDNRIKIFDYENNKGKALTLNKLIKESKNDWIAIQDDDDIWVPKKLSRQIKFLNDYDVIGTQISYIDEYENIIGGPNLSKSDKDIKLNSLKGVNQIANTSVILKKKCIEEVGGWDINLDGIEDFELWLKIMKKNYTFHNLSTIEVMHRLHKNSNFNTKQFNLNKIL